VDVEPPEVDQLAGGIDLGLLDGLALARMVAALTRFAPGSGEQLGGTQEDAARSSRVCATNLGRPEGGVDGSLHIRHRRLLEVSQLLGMPVRALTVSRPEPSTARPPMCIGRARGEV